MSTSGRYFGRYYEDFLVGQTYRHDIAKTITEGDNNLFCLLTMNHHPIHLNKEYARKTQHGKILVVGTYVLSLAVGLTVSDISGRAIANLDYEKVTHDWPVFIGDTIRVETEVKSKRISKSKPDRGIVCVETRAYNQVKKRVLTFTRHFMVPKMSWESQ